MKENNILINLSIDLAIEIVELTKILKSKQQSVIANQICRCGTSVGANIHEAQYAHSRADFIAKFEIALKEDNETSYWLLILYRTNYIDEQYYRNIDGLCSRIKAALVASCKTAKNNK